MVLNATVRCFDAIKCLISNDNDNHNLGIDKVRDPQMPPLMAPIMAPQWPPKMAPKMVPLMDSLLSRQFKFSDANERMSLSNAQAIKIRMFESNIHISMYRNCEVVLMGSQETTS